MKTLTLKKYITEVLLPDQKAQVDTWEKGDNSFSDHAFKDHPHTTTVELQRPNPNTPEKQKVEDHLGKHGYKISDYISGKAKDKYGRERNIGSLLVDTKAPQNVKNAFDNDQARKQNTKEDLVVRISRHPHHVAGMSSSGHSWENGSCMNFSNGIEKDYLKQDVQHGTHVAYLCHRDDKDIERPLARIALKKYTDIDDPSDAILRPEHRIYGDSPDSFHHTVNVWLNKHFPGNETGIYQKHPSVYDDTGNALIFGKKVLRNAAKSDDPDFRAMAAKQHDLPKRHLDKLIKDDDHDVKLAALTNENLTPEHIDKALDDKDHDIRKVAIQNKNASAENIDKALNLGNRFAVRSTALEQKRVNSDHLFKALDDLDPQIRLKAVNHRKAKKQHLEYAMNDENPEVSLTAKLLLQKHLSEKK